MMLEVISLGLRQRLQSHFDAIGCGAILHQTSLRSPWPMMRDPEMASAVHTMRHPIRATGMGVAEAKVSKTAGRALHDRELWSFQA